MAASDLGSLIVKKCTQCGYVKHESQFHLNYGKLRPYCKDCAKYRLRKWATQNRETHRRTQRRYYHSVTKTDPVRLEHKRAYSREWAKKRRQENPEFRKYVCEYQRQARFQNPIPFLIRSAKQRAKKKGVDFDLTVEWGERVWTGKCELTGIEFRQQTRKQGTRSPSIDRKDPARGYVQDNCRFILSAVNSLKGSDTDEEMITIATALVVRHR